MASLKQIEANRRNALLSTGPKTPEGKAAVSLNSLRHGLRARRVVLPGENPEEFQQLCDGLEAEWQPETPSERFYLEQMAINHWKLARMDAAEENVYRQKLEAQPEVLLLDRLWQAQNRMERSFARAMRELIRLQEFRLKCCPQDVTVHWIEPPPKDVPPPLPPAVPPPEPPVPETGCKPPESETGPLPHPDLEPGPRPAEPRPYSRCGEQGSASPTAPEILPTNPIGPVTSPATPPAGFCDRLTSI